MTDAAPDRTPALEVRNISKSFGSTRALADVSMTLGKGEILGLLGQNGSGKSTLVGVLAGYHVPERGGEVLVSGRPADLPVVRSDHGLSFVFQDLGLAGGLTVLENLRMWRWSDPHAGRWWISRRAEAREAREILAHYGVSLPLHRSVSTLSLLQQAMLAIVRSVAELRRFAHEKIDSSGILVLDEPTVFLPSREKEFLFDLIRRVAAGGSSVILVSHDLHAVREVARRVVVLRDGRMVGDAMVATTSDNQLAQMVLGAALEPEARRAPRRAAGSAAGDDGAATPPRLEVRSLAGGRVQGVDLSIAAGEIVGLAGLVGSGTEDIPYLLLGAVDGASGEVCVAGRSVDVSKLTPQRAIDMGIAVVPSDRKSDGLVDVFAIWENAQLLRLRHLFLRGWLRRRQAMRRAQLQCHRFDVKPPRPWAAVGALSGGNQQKVLLAKWLEIEPSVLVLHEPTQGVDLGARAEIVRIVKERAAGGTAVVWVTSDFEEMAGVSDRVAVCASGRIVGELVGSDITKEAIDDATLRAGGRAARDGAEGSDVELQASADKGRKEARGGRSDA